MKILQVNNVYGEKSTGKLTRVLHEGLLELGHEAIAVYGRGEGRTDPGVIRLCPDWYGKANSLLSRITGLPYGGCLWSTWRLQRIILREKPDVVHLQCINGNFVNIYRLITWLKNQKIRTVISLHAEFLYTANCGHAYSCDQWKTGCSKCPNRGKINKSWFFDRTASSWNRMHTAFAGFERDCILCPVSPWTEERARQSAILKDFSFQTVLNGVNTEFFHGASGAETIKDRPEILHVTAHFSPEKEHPKGGWYLLQLAKRMPDVIFQVAGPADPISEHPKNLKLLGMVKDQEKLAQLYRDARLSLLVSRRETFSMPCAESLCCGTPVVGFRAGGPEQIALPEYSDFAEFGDLDQLEHLIRKWLYQAQADRGEISARGIEKYSDQTMIRNYLDVYGRILWK